MSKRFKDADVTDYINNFKKMSMPELRNEANSIIEGFYGLMYEYQDKLTSTKIDEWFDIYLKLMNGFMTEMWLGALLSDDEDRVRHFVANAHYISNYTNEVIIKYLNMKIPKS